MVVYTEFPYELKGDNAEKFIIQRSANMGPENQEAIRNESIKNHN